MSGREGLDALVVAKFGRHLSDAELRRRIDEQAEDDGSTLLHDACFDESEGYCVGPALIELLVREYGANPRVRTHTRATPIMHAIICNNAEHVQALLHCGVSINETCCISDGRPLQPLQVAHYDGWVAIAKLLLDLGADYQYAWERDDVPVRAEETDAIYDYVRAIHARERRAQLACFALLLVRCLPRDVLRVVARLMWQRRRGERWD